MAYVKKAEENGIKVIWMDSGLTDDGVDLSAPTTPPPHNSSQHA